MRIAGGSLRGRKIPAAPSGVRPTQERVREALFSSLQERIPGAHFVDVFAGSGLVGIEAWSRGAASVLWVERDRRIFRALKKNVASLCDDADGVCICKDACAFFTVGRFGEKFDIIFADPPYNKPRRGGVDEGHTQRLLDAIRESDVLAERGIVVLEQGSDEPFEVSEGWTVLRDKVYGGTRLLTLELESI